MEAPVADLIKNFRMDMLCKKWQLCSQDNLRVAVVPSVTGTCSNAPFCWQLQKRYESFPMVKNQIVMLLQRNLTKGRKMLYPRARRRRKKKEKRMLRRKKGKICLAVTVNLEMNKSKCERI